MKLMSRDRALSIFDRHRGETLVVAFVKRTDGGCRCFRCRPVFKEEPITELDCMLVVRVTGGGREDVRFVPLDGVRRIESEHLVYTPRQ